MKNQPLKPYNAQLKLALLAILIAISASCFAQDESIVFSATNWKVGKTVTIHGHKILKVESGEEYGYTHIRYKTKQQIIDEQLKKANNELWDSTKLANRLSSVERLYPGGEIALFIGRLTIGGANTEYFTVVIKQEDKIILRRDLDQDIPNTPKGDRFWTNSDIVNIDVELIPPFQVYVIDKLSDTRSEFKILN